MPQNTLEKPKNKTLTKDDISLKETSDLFWMQRIFKWFFLICTILLLSVILCLYIYGLVRNATLRQQLLDNITSNMQFVIVAVLSIFGFKLYKS